MCIHRRVTHRCLVRAAHRLSNCLNVFRQNRLYVVTTRRFVLGVFATRRKLQENREETERSELSPLAIVRMRVSSRAPIVEQGRSGAAEKDRRERCDRRRRRREQRSSRTRGKRTTKRGDTVRARLLIVFFRRVSVDQRRHRNLISSEDREKTRVLTWFRMDRRVDGEERRIKEGEIRMFSFELPQRLRRVHLSAYW